MLIIMYFASDAYIENHFHSNDDGVLKAMATRQAWKIKVIFIVIKTI